MDGRRVVWGRIALEVRRVVGLRVAPAADLETKLARMRPLGEDGVETREATLLAVRPDEPLPLQGVGEVRGAWADPRCRVASWLVNFWGW